MRLIDADALIADLDKGLWGKEWDKALAEAIIEDAPTIDIEERLNDAYAHGWSDAEAKYHDAVEVVQCRNCKHWDTDWKTMEGCEYKHWCNFIDLITDADFYCKHGERKDKDE